jgi:hypothetical protein
MLGFGATCAPKANKRHGAQESVAVVCSMQTSMMLVEVCISSRDEAMLFVDSWQYVSSLGCEALLLEGCWTMFCFCDAIRQPVA